MDIVTPEPATYPEMLELQLARLPRWERANAAVLFEGGAIWTYRNFRAAYVDGGLVGWGFTAHPIFFPSDRSILSVTVAAAHEGQGIGAALRAALTKTLPDTTTNLAGLVDDEEERSLAVTRHWGYEVRQHGIRSRLDLVDLPVPAFPAGFTVEDVSALDVPDPDAVEAMLIDSQTNPEAIELGMISTLVETRLELEDCDHPFALLARLDGAPAAIIIGQIKNALLLIHYTGVGRPFRGRGFAFLLKQEAHLRAAAAGAVASVTTNEASNAGIRHVNRKLGYRVVGGDYRIGRPR